jgi:hypothetical protein
MGEDRMSKIIWQCKKGSISVFTRKIDIANKEKQNGAFVRPISAKPRIFVHSH